MGSVQSGEFVQQQVFATRILQKYQPGVMPMIGGCEQNEIQGMNAGKIKNT
jgi:hypothetical protein